MSVVKIILWIVGAIILIFALLILKACWFLTKTWGHHEDKP